MFYRQQTAKTPQFVTSPSQLVFCGLQGASKGTSRGNLRQSEARDGSDVVGGLRCFVGVLKVQTTRLPPTVTNTTFICLHFRLCFNLTDVTS